MQASFLPSGRPLLKWAGGKRQLLPVLRRYYPAEFDRYIEPFVGSGAVFFDLHASGRLIGRSVRLSDLNPDLIGCYRTVRDDADRVIAALAELDEEHRARGSACYYDVRDRRFNPSRAGLAADVSVRYTPKLAAMLIYLNRTGYNGLFRLNSNGGFNVPAGRYTDPSICDPDHIRSVARALGADGVTLVCGRFDETITVARAGDFVYCDPPYAPLSRTASFAQYTAAGFHALDQRRLQTAILAAARRGAVVLISNSSAPEIEAGYSGSSARAAGLMVEHVPARRAINSRATRRGPVDELIITNARVKPLNEVPIRMLPARRSHRTNRKSNIA
jgi:DNA adenine methylase